MTITQLPHLGQYDIATLTELAEKVEAAIRERRASEVKAIADELKARLEKAGLTLKEVVKALNHSPKASSTATVAAKRRNGKGGGKALYWYRNPNNTNEVWKGKARRPEWLLALLEEGIELKDMQIPNPEVNFQ